MEENVDFTKSFFLDTLEREINVTPFMKPWVFKEIISEVKIRSDNILPQEVRPIPIFDELLLVKLFEDSFTLPILIFLLDFRDFRVNYIGE